jgi:transposase
MAEGSSSGFPLSVREKRIIVNIYDYLSGQHELHKVHKKLSLRKRTAVLSGFGETTVGRVIGEYRKSGIEGLLPPQHVGRHPVKVPTEMKECLSKVVRDLARSGSPSSVKVIKCKMEEVLGCELSDYSVYSYLTKLGYKWGRGERIHTLHESNSVQLLRSRYLRKRLQNINAHGMPKLPEAFYDESYCSEGHVWSRTWLEPDDPSFVCSTTRGGTIAVIGLGVVFCQAGGDKLSANWARGFPVIWNPSPTGKPRGRRKHGVETPTADFVGNMNSQLFEKAWTMGCKQLYEDYGACIIHMDNAQYHKETLRPIISQTARKANLAEWLRSEGIMFSPDAKRVELINLVKQAKQQMALKVDVIAQQNGGHQVLFTPPYHSELNPIEYVWATAKQYVAKNPATSVSDLKEKFQEGLTGIVDEHTWLNSWHRSYRNCISYWEQLDDEEEGGQIIEGVEEDVYEEEPIIEE